MKLRLALLSAALIFGTAASAAELNFTPLQHGSVYAPGDETGWTVAPGSDAVAKARYVYSVKTDQMETVASGSFDLAKGSVTIAAKVDRPAMLYAVIDRALPPQPSRDEAVKLNAGLKALLAKNDPTLKTVFEKYPDYCIVAEPCQPGTQETVLTVPGPEPEGHLAVLGAAVAPAKIEPSAARPADFDAFWAGKLAELRKVPMNPKLTPVATVQPNVKLYMVELDSLGSHVHGYLAVPAGKGPFPAMLVYQFAGVYALSPQTCANRAAEGWLCFNVDSHDMRPDEATAPKNYYEIGNTSRETSYFLPMYLRDSRALDWVRTLKSWNRKTTVITGTSMGGQQSLVTAGLNPGKITAVVVNEPSGGDFGSELHGRKAAYPNWAVTDPRVVETGHYFDTANFAAKITAPTLIAVGFIDKVCPPASVLSAANRIPAPKEIVPMTESDHNNYTPHKQDAFLQRSEEIFATLLHGGKFVPYEGFSKGK
jgi:cephalosporin-C deacetylase